MRNGITEILKRASGGDDAARDQLAGLTLVELRSIAAQFLNRERPDHTLTPTALADEAFVNLVGPQPAAIDWESRAHFLAVAAAEIRRILVEHARRHNALKRGGGANQVPLSTAIMPCLDGQADVDVLALHETLDQLAVFEPDGARIVEMRFFGGMTMEEIAEVSGRPLRTIEREWAAARAWLHARLVD